MNIKEVEQQLSVTRANIRFYEKEGLLRTERKSNNYRDYSEENVRELKKIVLLRKLGFSIDEIRRMQSGELDLNTAASANTERLEGEIESLKGALSMTKKLSAEKCGYAEIDEEKYWNDMLAESNKGSRFADILKDCADIGLLCFDSMWKWSFLFDFKKARSKHGALKATLIMLAICVLRGLSNKFIWQGSFLEGFLYPFLLFAPGAAIIIPLFLLSKKHPKCATIIATVLVTVFVIFLAAIFIIVIIGMIGLLFNSFA